MEKYSILQQKPTIQQEFDKLLTSAVETAQSLISFVPPMVVDCLPNPDIASKAYPTLLGDPTNYVTTTPALFFSYEADGDKINGKCELLPPESCCFSRNCSGKESGIQVSKKESETQTELQFPAQILQSGFPHREGGFSNGNSSTKIRKESKISQSNGSANRQMKKGNYTISEQYDLPPHISSTWGQKFFETDL